MTDAADDTHPNTDSQENTKMSKHMLDAEWSVDHEHILVEWADKSMCMRLLHAKATASYSRRNMWYTLPVIVMSTLAGAANFSQERVPEEYRGLFSMCVGLLNIIAGIVTTVQQFLKITQLNEAHRVSSIAWDKFYRNIKTELAKHPKERIPVITFLKMCKEEYDRLMETSPVIPEPIIDAFNKTFDPSTKKGALIKDIVKPEICDVLVPTDMSRNPWFTEENMQKERASQFRDKLQHTAATKRTKAYQRETVCDFKKMFINLNNRDPLDDEIIGNLEDSIDPQIIRDILRQDASSAVELGSLSSSSTEGGALSNV
jgi:hypothetical protein